MNDYKNFLDRHRKYLRYLLLLSLITFVILFIASAAHGAWYPDSNWQYRKKITIQSSRVIGGPHSNFPVLISLSTDTDLAADAQDNGYDILFTSSGGDTKIPHEIEKFDGGSGELVAWVKVGSISSSGDTDIYMYYGNLSASDQQQQAPTATEVWDSNYTAVWHLKETSGGADAIKDSTARANHGTDFNSPTFGVTGKIGNAVDFDGTADYVTMPTSGFNTSAGTVELWTNIDTFPSADNKYMFSHLTSPTANRVYVNLKPDNTWGTGMGDTYDLVRGSVVSAGTWYHLVLTWDGTNVRGYKDGALNFGPTSYSGLTTVGNIYVSAWDGTAEWFDGTLDEVRVSETVRSADWIQTEYNNQVWPNTAVTPSPLPSPNPGGGFINVGSESTSGGGNQSPVADSGTDQNVGTGATVALDGSGSSDPDGDPLAYTWSFISKPGGSSATLSDPNIENPTFDADVSGTYELRLIVNDGTVDSAPNTVTITATLLGLSGYSCNMKIIIKGSEVQGGPHNEFPVLISLTKDTLKTTGANCGFVTDSNGYDILFTDSAKTTQLDHEIEKYDGDTGELIAWVKMDLNASPSNTDIYMYYGNSSAGDQQNPTGVWDSSYKGVWHLKETPTVDSYAYDSTANNNDGSFGSAMSSGDQESGKIVGSLDFDGGSNDYVELPDLITSNTGTISLWVQPSSMTSHTIFDASTGSKYFYIDINSSSSLRANMEDSSDADFNTSYDVSSLTANEWYHLSYVWRFGSSPAIRLYLDGALVDENTGTTGTIADFLTIYLGYTRSNYHTTYALTGNIDEVRLSNAVRTDDWIKTSYINQSDPGNFISVEPAQCPDSTPQISEFACSMKISINPDKVAGGQDLPNFPVLISLTHRNLKSTSTCGQVSHDNGYDIIFTKSDRTTQLDHEIEKYDKDTGELIAWVKVPVLDYDDPTDIYMFLGNSSVCSSTENPTGVWDSNYEAVLHLQESGNGTSNEFKDSTSNVHHGTGGGLAGAGNSSMTPNRVTGKFGYAQDFDGGNDLIRLNAVDDGSWTAVTVQAWLNPDDTGDDRLFGKCWGTGGDDETFLLRKTGGSIGVRMRTDTNYNGGHDPGSLSTGNWQLVAATWDASDNQLRVYKNGVQQGATTLNGNHLFSNSSGEAGYPDADYVDEPTLGNTPANDRDYNGKMQEARVSKIARSADWLLTEYNNQSDPSGFLLSVENYDCPLVLSGYSCSRKITVDHRKVSGTEDLQDFPLLLKIERDCKLRTTGNDGEVYDSTGKDILFTDSTQTVQLDHEIEMYEPATGELVAWVKVPVLDHDDPTDIYMYYGKDGLTCDNENATGVWDSSYTGVWHLAEDPSGTAPQMRDGSSTANHGTSQGSMTSGDQVAGRIDGSLDFDGSNDYVEVAHSSSYLLDDGTVSFWFKANNVTSQQGLWSKDSSGNDTGGHLTFTTETNSTIQTRLQSTTASYTVASSAISQDTWYLANFTFGSGGMKLYLNDGAPATNAYTGGLGTTSGGTGNFEPIAIGGNTMTSGDLTVASVTDLFDGQIDEVRISNTVRSADWIKTEYDNQTNPDFFYSMSNVSCGGNLGFNFSYCKKITVESELVSADLDDFPLLINITDDNLKSEDPYGGLVGSDEGYDIIFKTSNCVTLDHEIEKYKPDTGELVAWVRIPTLSGSEDTEIYMYFGNSLIDCPTENPTAVWDSNYVGVWHLDETVSNESTAGTHYDSTGNSNNGAQNDNDDIDIDEKIGTGQMFDGSSDWIQVPDSSSVDITGSQITLSAWVKSTADQNDDAGIVIKNNQGGVYNYNLNVQDSDQGNFRVTTSTGETYLTAGPALTADQWYFLYGIYDGANAKLYLDGSEVGTAARTGNILSTNEPVLIGRRALGDPRYFTGVIDEVHISNVARSTDWMITEYNNQSDPNFIRVGSCFEQTMTQTNAWEEEYQ